MTKFPIELEALARINGIELRTSSVSNPEDKTVVLAKSEEVIDALAYRLLTSSLDMKLLLVLYHKDYQYALGKLDHLARVIYYGSDNAEYDFVAFHNANYSYNWRKPSYGVYYCRSAVTICDGMKLVRSNAGDLLSMRHIGGVVFGTGVEIGSNTIIHRAVFDYTVIGNDVKIGSMCNVGHNVAVGDRTLIMSGANVGGSVKVGSGCFIGLGAVILPHLRIADSTMVGAGSVVTKNIEEPGKYYGNPARYHGPWKGDW